MSDTSLEAPPSAEQAPNKGGAPLGNTNRFRHGLRVSDPPPDTGHLKEDLGDFRLKLERIIDQQYGEAGIYQLALIQSAVRHERRAKLLEQWLRKSGPNGLLILERAQLLREISAATDSRDKCLEKLKLDRDQQNNILETIYAKPVPTLYHGDASGSNGKDAAQPAERDSGDSGASSDVIPPTSAEVQHEGATT